MYLRRCYIENFGKLHKFEYEFSEGLNVINELNGWGKSTFATFIKVMFFGFDSSNRKAISENERKKYYPWQDGKLGGNIEFEVDGKIYEIERFFGIKDKEDTFKIYNKTTNSECNDFSENIGQEIFKIDRQAYERSTYIPQHAINIEINDSISAKLSNVLENDNDINSSEKAIDIITSAMKEYKKTGNKGRINELESKINDKKRELEYAEKNEDLISERNKKIEEIKDQIRICETQRNKNQEKINDISEKENLKLKNKLEILNQKLETQKKIEKMQEKSSKQKYIKIISSILITLLGIILGIFLSKYLYLISALGILILIFTVINVRKLNKKYKKEYEKIDKLEETIEVGDITENKEDIIKQNEILNRNITALVNQKTYDESEINRLINTEASAGEIEEEIEGLEEELNEMNKKYNILDRTRGYLLKAKEQFSSHYLKGMTEGFERYFELINNEKMNIDIDIALNAKIEEYGEKKELDYLSSGYKDLIGICIRLALVDALFENEKPFIILDDPFVNLDKEKIEKAKEIVKELSKKYQVIYFTCHPCRGNY